MDDTIEICSGCGKMPRAIDSAAGIFTCSRCGNHTTMHVTAENYEKVVTDLDHKFHMVTQKQRIEAAASSPVEAAPKISKASKKPVKSSKKAPAGKPKAKAKRKR